MKEKISYKKFLELISKEEGGEETKKEEKKEEIRGEDKREKKRGEKTKKDKKTEEKKVREELKEKEVMEKEENLVPAEEYLPFKKEEKIEEAIIELEEEKEEEFLVFKVSDEFYAIYTHQAVEVVKDLDIFEAPDLPDYAIGMTNFRNIMIPVISFSKLLNLEEERKPYSYIFIEKDKREGIFIRTGEVKGIYKKREVKLFEVPYDLDKEIFKKIILIDDNLVPLIDILKLIEKKE